MKVHVAGKAVATLFFLSLFPACGELETLLPSTGSYQVKTLVNGNSLESCSIIRSDDQIHPYFVASVVNDPDLIGLSVYFENSRGEIIGEKIRYILRPYAKEAVPAETEGWEEGDSDSANDTVSGEETEDEEDNVNGLTVREQRTFANTQPVEKTTGVEIAVQSLAGELPRIPLSKNLEIGPYTLVFEALGEREILSRTETYVFYLGSAQFNLKDITMYLPRQSGSQLISPGITVMLEARLDFDSRLDPYVIWYNGKTIISEGKISDGAESLLWKAPEQAGFYSLRLEAFPFRFKRNLTGVSREVALPVSPKAVNPGYFFENDASFTARNPLAAGTVYPEQVRLIQAMSSSEEESTPAKPLVLPLPPELLQWYQFEGSLHNTASLPDGKQSLLPAGEKAPRWTAAGQSYGLAAGSDVVYLLSPIKFFRKENDQGGGIFLLHIMPAAEGTIFSAFFPLRSSLTNGAWMDMVREGNSITLRLNAEGTTVGMPVYLVSSGPEDFITIAIEFYIQLYRIDAKISLSNDYFLQNNAGSIKLSEVLSGEGSIRLGGGGIDKSMIDKPIVEITPTIHAVAPSTSNVTEFPFEEDIAAITPITDSAENDTDNTADITAASISPIVNQNTIWDEFAILFSSVPLQQEELSAPTVTEGYAPAASNDTKTGKAGGYDDLIFTVTDNNDDSIRSIIPPLPNGKQSYNF